MKHNGDVSRADQFEELIGRIGKKANARTVYGEPTIVGDRAVIPVAEIKYGGGGGWGGGYTPAVGTEAEGTAESTAGEGEGMGMGFGVSAKPIGALEVTPDGVHWSPVFDWSRLLTMWSAITGFVVVVAAIKWLFSRNA